VEGVLKGSVADPDTHMPVKLVARYLAPFVGKDGVSHLLNLASSISGEDMDDIELKTIHVPALIIWGDKDQWLSPKVADRLSNELPDGRLTRLPSVGRLVPEESPEQLNQLLLDFMRRRAVA
jgi:pimeloyl-ACP methyl ester carboxylesterase